jgi:hypothetical protein
LSSIPNLTLEEAQEMLENADPETSNIDKLQEITDN